MSETHESTTVCELPLDFTQFLSARLGTELGEALSVLGSFLLTFEPSERRAGSALLRPSPHPAVSPT
ncbi:MAG: hypothetical protein EOO73_07895 [Myxococcales bacterium]|nr:MAG: hypothetical protein EOO73_07895 [Myxococcales bacterium]